MSSQQGGSQLSRQAQAGGANWQQVQQPQLGLFNDAHGFLHSVAAEVDVFKQQIAQTDETRRAEIEEMRKELEQQRFERRDALNKLRYEFEEFVHRKIDKVLEDVEEMKKSEKCDDSTQQDHIDSLIEQTGQLKEKLFVVQGAWGKLVSQCLIPIDNPTQNANARRDARRASANQNQQPVTMLPPPGAGPTMHLR